MPIYKTKNEDFFKKWSSDMAYVLGFFIADGSIIINSRGARYIDLCITDKDLLLRIREVLGSNHKISEIDKGKNCKMIYRLQIGSKEMFDDLLNLGLKTNKTGHEILPNVPKALFKDFIRGYFDGDGNVYIVNYERKDRKNKFLISLMTCFTCSNKNFLKSIKESLGLVVKGGTLYFSGGAWRLCFSKNDSLQLYEFMYNKVNDINGLFLKRKRNVFREFINNNMRV